MLAILAILNILCLAERAVRFLSSAKEEKRLGERLHIAAAPDSSYEPPEKTGTSDTLAAYLDFYTAPENRDKYRLSQSCHRHFL